MFASAEQTENNSPSLRPNVSVVFTTAVKRVTWLMMVLVLLNHWNVKTKITHQDHPTVSIRPNWNWKTTNCETKITEITMPKDFVSWLLLRNTHNGWTDPETTNQHSGNHGGNSRPMMLVGWLISFSSMTVGLLCRMLSGCRKHRWFAVLVCWHELWFQFLFIRRSLDLPLLEGSIMLDHRAVVLFCCKNTKSSLSDTNSSMLIIRQCHQIIQ